MANIIDIKIPKVIAAALRIPQNDPHRQQVRVLKKLLRKAKFTEFGQRYRFDDLLLSKQPTKGFLMIGGATDLQKGKAGWYAGDLSGILAKKRPFWFQTFYKPGGRIAAMKDWKEKLNEIVEHAREWDIGYIVGVPAWCQMCLEMVIEHYKVRNIHEIWPNLGFFVHGGVAFEPYKKGFEKLLGKPIVYIENYLSSEGFIGYKDRQHAKGMRLILNNNIFMEFVPFNDTNFDSDGKMVEKPQALMIHEVEEGRDYALL